MDALVTTTCALVTSFVFVTAALHKWQNSREFSETLRAYRLLPDSVLAPMGRMFPFLEGLVGIGVLVPASTAPAGQAAALLLTLYAGAMAINLVRGRRDIDCGCGPTSQHQRLSGWLLVRNAILAGIALVAAGGAGDGGMNWFEWLVTLMAAASCCLVYLIGNQLLVNDDLLRSLRMRHG